MDLYVPDPNLKKGHQTLKEVDMNRKGNSTLELNRVIRSVRPSRGLFFGLLILGALLAFEIFNYSTTDFALTDLLGNLTFVDVRWATILAIAFCAIDFAGIARLFTPERGVGEPKEVWYLFGAWLLAATMNAMLTWWGVVIAILSHASLGDSIISPDTMIKVVPVFVAIMVWVIRVLIIGSFSVAGNRLFSQSEPVPRVHQATQSGHPHPLVTPNIVPAQATTLRPDPKNDPVPAYTGNPPREPTYHPVSLNGANPGQARVRK